MERSFNEELGRRLASLDRGEIIDQIPRPLATQIRRALEAACVSRNILSVDADFDLDDIWEYIAADDIDAADHWIEKQSVHKSVNAARRSACATIVHAP